MSGHKPWREVRDLHLATEEAREAYAAAKVQRGDKIRLVVDGKTFVGIYPDGPWEEES